MIRVSNIRVSVREKEPDLSMLVAKATGFDDILSFKIVKKSIDARKKSDIHFLYAVDITLRQDEEKAVKKSKYPHVTLEKEESFPSPSPYKGKTRPVVVGSGPAGLMAGLLLAEAGAEPIIIERGKPVAERQKDVRIFWDKGVLETSSNVLFGEGGAGTFSDGKLSTGIKKDSHTQKVLTEFVNAGAPEEIMYLAKPHIGTDYLSVMVQNIRKKLIGLGAEYRFSSAFVDFKTKDGAVCSALIKDSSGNIGELDTDRVILAIGHSARDTFEMLCAKGVSMIQKSFSVGARIEHLQEKINRAQYGTNDLGAADYKLSVHLPNGRSAYTFCMCPGGAVVAAASEEGHIVTNGMSAFARDMTNANSALLVGIEPSDFGGDHPLQGVYFQRDLERKAFLAGGGGYHAPAQMVGDFLKNRQSKAFLSVKPSYRPEPVPADMRSCLPLFVIETMQAALLEMNKKITCFADGEAVLTGVETRSSSPVRLLRDKETLESVSYKGLYPCGEEPDTRAALCPQASTG